MQLNKGVQIAFDVIVIVLFLFTFPFLLIKYILEELPT